MKKFFRMLLLAAVALMPVMGMAQDNVSESQQEWEQQMRAQQYADSVKAAQQDAEYRQEVTLASMRNNSRHLMLSTFMNQQIWIPTAFFGCIIGIVALCLRHSRKKAEDQKELINKLIDNNLLNSTETISKETIEALMNPNSKKSEKERFITDATLLGLGLGLLFGSTSLHGDAEDLLIFVGMTLAGLGLFRLIIRTITTIIERKNAKNKVAEEPKVIDAEFVEEK